MLYTRRPTLARGFAHLPQVGQTRTHNHQAYQPSQHPVALSSYTCPSTSSPGLEYYRALALPKREKESGKPLPSLPCTCFGIPMLVKLRPLLRSFCSATRSRENSLSCREWAPNPAPRMRPFLLAQFFHRVAHGFRWSLQPLSSPMSRSAIACSASPPFLPQGIGVGGESWSLLTLVPGCWEEEEENCTENRRLQPESLANRFINRARMLYAY